MSDGLFASAHNRVGVGREVAHLRMACASVELVELSVQSVKRLNGRADFGDCKGGTIIRSIYGSCVWHLMTALMVNKKLNGYVPLSPNTPSEEDIQIRKGTHPSIDVNILLI